VVGVFRDPERARGAISALRDAGFSGDDVSLLMPDRAERRDAATEDQASEGALGGTMAGGILGGLGGFLVGMSTLAVPVIGPVIAAGAIATALVGMAAGAAVGAIAGALVAMGIPAEEAAWYENEARGGRTLVAVKADGRYDEAQRILRRYGAYDVQTREKVGTSGES
jgi:hypothetical protein